MADTEVRKEPSQAEINTDLPEFVNEVRAQWQQEYEQKLHAKNKMTPQEMRTALEEMEPMTAKRRDDLINKCLMNTLLVQDDDTDKISQALGTYFGMMLMLAIDARQRMREVHKVTKAEKKQEKWIDRKMERENSVASSIDNIMNDRDTSWDWKNTAVNQAAARFRWKAYERQAEGKPMVPGFRDEQVEWFINEHIDSLDGVSSSFASDPRLIAEMVNDQIIDAYSNTDQAFDDSKENVMGCMDEVAEYLTMAHVPMNLFNQELIWASVDKDRWSEPDVYADWQDNPYVQAGLLFEEMAGPADINESCDRNAHRLIVFSDGTLGEEYMLGNELIREHGFSGKLTLRDPMNTDEMIDAVYEEATNLAEAARLSGTIESLAKSYVDCMEYMDTHQDYGFWNSADLPEKDKPMFNLLRAQALASFDERMFATSQDVEYSTDMSMYDRTTVNGHSISDMISPITDLVWEGLDYDVWEESLDSLFTQLHSTYQKTGGFGCPEEGFIVDSIIFGESADLEGVFGYEQTPLSPIVAQILQLNLRAYADGNIAAQDILETTCSHMKGFYENGFDDDDFWHDAGYAESPREMLDRFMWNYEPCEMTDDNCFGTGPDDLVVTPFKNNLVHPVWWQSERSSSTSLKSSKVPHIKPKVCSVSEDKTMVVQPAYDPNYDAEARLFALAEALEEKEKEEESTRDFDDYAL